MDGGPFRASGPTDRRVVNRPEPTHRQPEELQSVQPEPKVVHRATAPHRAVKEEKSFKRFIWPIVAVIVIIAAIVGWFGFYGYRGYFLVGSPFGTFGHGN